MPRLNAAQKESLSRVILGTAQLKKDKGRNASLQKAYSINRRALDFAHLTTDSLSDEQLAEIYEFLIWEFAQIHEPDPQCLSERAKRSRFDSKMAWLHFLLARGKHPPDYGGFSEFIKVHGRYQAARTRMHCPVDVLFVTAVPVEYIAMLRHCVDYFLESVDPLKTRRFEKLHPHHTWVVGTVNERRRAAKVGILLCNQYGPVGAGNSVKAFLQRYVPRHVVVSGIAASLNDSRFSMGDLGWSESIHDISLAKFMQDDSSTTSVTMQTAPNWSALTDAQRERFLDSRPQYIQFRESDRHLTVRGVLDETDLPLLRNCFSSEEDARSIEVLHIESLHRAERMDLHSNAVPYRCASRLLDSINSVARENTWQANLVVSRPSGSEPPRAIPVQTLSGSWVVKQHGMRRLLQKLFPEYWMLEMEGGGVAQACLANGIAPAVVKSVCDFATPAKRKTWQPYCADVAAAFCRELAIALAAVPAY